MAKVKQVPLLEVLSTHRQSKGGLALVSRLCIFGARAELEALSWSLGSFCLLCQGVAAWAVCV